MSALFDKIRLYGWGSAQLIRLGRPDVALGFLGGIGDDLLCTVVIDEWLRRGARSVWFFTRHPELYSHYDRRVCIIPEDARYQRLALRLGRPMRPVSYSTYDAATDRDSPLSDHLILAMCRRAGLDGRVRLRPHLPLLPPELAGAAQWNGCIALQTSSLTASVPMPNKQWPAERFQAVADHLAARGLHCVQIGSPSDPPLKGVTDLRGRTRLRETAAVLAQARLFVGIVGFLMHLARAVECPGVIVYGGREPPELTGYPCNINVTNRPPCAPCWQRARCDFAHACMDAISTGEVVAAIDIALRHQRGPLAEETADL
jgi:hypothetical protein